VTVSTAGNVSIQVTKAAPSTSFVGDFCQFPGSDFFVRGENSCFGLQTSLITDSSGNGQLTFHFPKAGVWSGAFVFAPGGDTTSSSTITTDNQATEGTLSSPLVPRSKTSDPSFLPSGTPQEPGSGSLLLSAGKVTITLKAATANAAFSAGECDVGGSSSCFQVGSNFNTDASGNATTTFAAETGRGSSFEVDRNVNPATFGFVTGFSVP
jgi:hypothetical protein